MFFTEKYKGTRNYLKSQKKYEILRTCLYFGISLSLYRFRLLNRSPTVRTEFLIVIHLRAAIFAKHTFALLFSFDVKCISKNCNNSFRFIYRFCKQPVSDSGLYIQLAVHMSRNNSYRL